MTSWRRGAWLGLLLAALAAGPAHAQRESARGEQAPTEKVLAETRQLLDWLGVLALLEQAPPVLVQALAAEAEFRQAKPAQVKVWQRRLAPTLTAAHLQQRAIRYVAARHQESSYRQAQTLLQGALAKRVRYFELAMTQPGVAAELRAFLAETGAVSAERRALIRQLVGVAGTDTLVALLQTEISERVRRAAGAPATAPGQLADELAERQRHLAGPTEDYLLYAYRYLRDGELVEYRQLLEDRDLQWLLEISRQAVTAALRNAD
jgi:hypothetical protein